MHRFARTVGRRLLPALAADRAIAFERRLRHELGVDRVALAVEAVMGRTVIGGPFEGTVLGNSFATTAASPVLKLLGMYEPVLQPALEIALERKPGVVANIGCADGYYSVGIARRLPAAVVHAYDLASSARADEGFGGGEPGRPEGHRARALPAFPSGCSARSLRYRGWREPFARASSSQERSGHRRDP